MRTNKDEVYNYQSVRRCKYLLKWIWETGNGCFDKGQPLTHFIHTIGPPLL